MRRALIVGVDNYPGMPLYGCVNDADHIAGLLDKNQDGSPNFFCKKLISTEQSITRPALRDHLQELFGHKADVALFYFAGHGSINKLGGYLVTQDYASNDEGVAMLDVLTLANQAKIDEVVIILDCCHSGAMGLIPALQSDQVQLREGVSILCATREIQLAVEQDGGGIFTTLICAALNGGASDVIGNVTVASLYAFVDQALGPWDQRPLSCGACRSILKLPIWNIPSILLLSPLRKTPILKTRKSSRNCKSYATSGFCCRWGKNTCILRR
jgi:hypothetical protein